MKLKLRRQLISLVLQLQLLQLQQQYSQQEQTSKWAGRTIDTLFLTEAFTSISKRDQADNLKPCCWESVAKAER